MTEPIVLATRNVGKLLELRPLFASRRIDVVDLAAVGLAEERPDEDAIESYSTFRENALAKARYFHEASGGRPCVADDSGLEVAVLGGQPGVRSRRWAATPGVSGAALDAANNARLIRELAGVADRRARFVCAAAFRHGERESVSVGHVEGAITLVAHGAHGFGYDPYFFATELGMTLAEATTEQKEVVSHRGRAFSALIEQIRPPG